MQYFIYRSDRQEGPYSAEDLRERLAKGELALTDFCFAEGMNGWTPLSEIGVIASTSQPPTLNSDESKNVFVWRNEQQFGPYSVEEVREYIAGGQFSPDDFARTEHQTEWTTLSSVMASAGPKLAIVPEQTSSEPSVTPGYEAAVVSNGAASRLKGRRYPLSIASSIALAVLVLAGGGLFAWWKAGGTAALPPTQAPVRNPVVATASPIAALPSASPQPASNSNASPTVGNPPASVSPPAVPETTATPASAPAPSAPAQEPAAPPPVAPAPAKPRTQLSRAMERALRLDYIGGLTDQQLVETADDMAKVLSQALPDYEIDKFYNGRDPETQRFSFMMFDHPDADFDTRMRLITQMQLCKPPRMVTRSDGGTHLPLPPKPWNRGDSQARAGRLFKEYLVPLRSAIFEIANQGSWPQEPSTYWNQISTQLESGKNLVLCASYLNEDGQTARPYYFWYQKAPDGLADLLKTLPQDHPIFTVGSPVDGAPEESRDVLPLIAKKGAPTEADIQAAILQSMAMASGGQGRVVDANSVQVTTPLDAPFHNYWLFHIRGLKLTKPPEPDSQGGFLVSYTDEMSVEGVILGQQNTPFVGGYTPVSEAQHFEFVQGKWYSPVLRDRMTKVIIMRTKGTTKVLDRFFNGPRPENDPRNDDDSP